jgi:gentisate 1,2-dioxygenase
MANESKLDITENGQYFEYTQSVNPLAKGFIPPVPFGNFLHTIHESGPSSVIPFDLSKQMACRGPATSPTLCANFIRIEPNKEIVTSVNASSEIYYVMRGKGVSQSAQTTIPWQKGDFMALPGGGKTTHKAENDSALYWVHDEPLLNYLGAKAGPPRFQATLYKAADALKELASISEDPESSKRNRISVILAHKNFLQTRSMTEVLWTMLGILPAKSIQPPHRHNSVALDLILDCEPGCYTLLGKGVDKKGNLINPIRVDWMPYSAFVTPPWLWHAHYNESDQPVHFVPVQDAGLHSYLRTLDIEFWHESKTVELEAALLKEFV